jgi:hypothetical protein
LVNDPDDDTLLEDEVSAFLECERDIKERPESFVSIAGYKKRRGFG